MLTHACHPCPATARHEEYRPSSFCNDIAVLELDRDAVAGRPVGALASNMSGLPEGYPLVAAGWGLDG